MEKLLGLKEWVTLGEAADIISNELKETVAIDDVCQLVLDGRLVISVNIINGTPAFGGKRVRFTSIQELAEICDNYGQIGDDEYLVPRSFTAQRSKDGGIELDHNQIYVKFKKEVLVIYGLIDLWMIGSEQAKILSLMEGKIGAATCPNIDEEGVFFKDVKNDCFFQVITSSKGEWVDILKNQRKPFDPDDFVMAKNLPDNLPLVVRTDELQRFVYELKEQNTTLNTKERENLLKTIGALLMVLKHEKGAEMSQSEVIQFIQEKRQDDLGGLSQSYLEKVFSEANRIFPNNTK